MNIELPPPPFKIAWGPVLWGASVIASILGVAYVPGEGINGATVIQYVMAMLFVPTGGWLAFPLVILLFVFALYDKFMFWLSLRSAPHSERTVLVPGQVLTFRPPIPADVPPTVQGFGSKPMTHPTEIVEI
jgi:hypothetical protein